MRACALGWCAGECACAPEAHRRADVELLNAAETNAGAVDCGGRAVSTAARCPAGGGVTGALLASHAGGVTSGRRRHRRAARIARRRGHQRAAASPARSSRHTPAWSAVGDGVTGAQLASRRGIVSMLARIALRRRARGAALANRARARRRRYGGHSIISSRKSMSKGVAPGCFSGDLGLVGVGGQPRCTTARQVDPPAAAGASGALLRTPMAVRPLAAGKVRALPSHRQAGNSGGGAGGAAARRGRVWGACRHGRALQKM